jgi:hypothetical protein
MGIRVGLLGVARRSAEHNPAKVGGWGRKGKRIVGLQAPGSLAVRS